MSYVSLLYSSSAYSKHTHLGVSQRTVTSYPRYRIRTIITSSLWLDFLHKSFNSAFSSAWQATCSSIFIRNYVQHVASDLIVTASQYRSGELGLIPELHPQLRKRLLVRRGAQKHQRRLPSRCDRLPPGSE